MWRRWMSSWGLWSLALFVQPVKQIRDKACPKQVTTVSVGQWISIDFPVPCCYSKFHAASISKSLPICSSLISQKYGLVVEAHWQLVVGFLAGYIRRRWPLTVCEIFGIVSELVYLGLLQLRHFVILQYLSQLRILTLFSMQNLFSWRIVPLHLLHSTTLCRGSVLFGSLQGGGEVIVHDGPHLLHGCRVHIPPGKNRGVPCLDTFAHCPEILSHRDHRTVLDNVS